MVTPTWDDLGRGSRQADRLELMFFDGWAGVWHVAASALVLYAARRAAVERLVDR